MNQIFIFVISVIVIVGAGVSIILFYTPSDIPDITDNTLTETAVPVEETKPPEEKKVVVPKPTSTPKPTPTPTPKPIIPILQSPKEYIIEIHGFTDWRPSSITIFVGDTITFVNLDDELHWPGADPHPTHSALPLFDALGGISKGQSYSHTFTMYGIYGHHDHLPDDPPTLGFITVLPRE